MTGAGAFGDLELRGVRKSFGRNVAIAGLDLRLDRGEMVALLGPSGCGKTTTLRIVAGFEQPDAGDVWLRGTLATRLPPHRRDVGVVFQSYALFPHMTAFDNVAYGLRRRGVAGRDLRRRVEETLAMVHLEALGGRLPRELSGGQQQRVAVARAIVIQPSILLFDEPLSNLDAKLRQAMRGELRAVQQRLGITALFVTHDQEEALALADRIAVMNAGMIEQIGTGEEVYRRPRTRFVAGFIGECNFLTGRLHAGGGLEVGGGRVPAPPGTVIPIGPVTVALRPEDVRLGAAPEPGEALLPGRVTGVVYLGITWRYSISLPDGTEVTVVRQRDTSAPFRPSDEVVLAWLPQDAVLYAGSG